MTSNPTLDPEVGAGENAESGTYINKVLSAADTPGSIFKLVTTKAALENIAGIDDWSFTCTGSHVIDGEKITCTAAHGRQNIYGALSNSCNCAYASLAVELGSDVMEKTVERQVVFEGVVVTVRQDRAQLQGGKLHFRYLQLQSGLGRNRPV